MKHRPNKVRKSLKHEMNIVPYVDVMFVLLTIFMVTATTISAGLEVNPPEVSTEHSLNLEDNPLMVISVDAQGQWYFNLSSSPDQPLTTEQISIDIQQAIMENPQLQAAVKGDKNAPLGSVVDAMVLLKKYTHQSVKMITAPVDVF